MNIVLLIFQLVGSLGLFLYGMKILSDGLQKAAGTKMKSILQMMTSNRIASIFTGVLITVIIQSSSATTVMVVSFVNASLINLTQAIGVILGANVGTTITGWIVALLGFKANITDFALIAIAVALPLMFSKKVKRREVAEIFLGFGLLFLGLAYLSQATSGTFDADSSIFGLLKRFDDGSFLSVVICVIIGTVVTMVVQSSSATMAITITLAFNGLIGVYTACALCLGQNIGTTITAYIASIGTSTNAKRAAWSHIALNVISTVVTMIFFKPFVALINLITPGDLFALSAQAQREAMPTFLAMFHTLYAVAKTIAFFPFVKQFAKLLERLIPEKVKYDDNSYHFTYIANTYLDTAEPYLFTVQGEIKKMATLSSDMFKRYTSTYNFDGKQKGFDLESEIAAMKHYEDYADQMQEQLTTFCVHLVQDSQNPTNAEAITNYIRVLDELESVTDSIYNLAKLTESRIQGDFRFTDEEVKQLDEMNAIVQQFLDFIKDHVDTGFTVNEYNIAFELEKQINNAHKALSDLVHNQLASETSSIPMQLMVLEVAKNLEHVGDYAINIAESYYKEYKTGKHSAQQVKI